jgi:hypothetical protein
MVTAPDMIASMTNRRTANKAPNPENEPILVILAILLLGALSIYATRHRFDQRTTAHDYFNPRSESRSVLTPWGG